MYVHHMRPADARSPTHSPRAFLQFIALSDDGTRHIERTQVHKIQLHIVQYLVIGTSIQSLRRRPIANARYCAECSRGISACPNGGAWRARHGQAPQLFIPIHH